MARISFNPDDFVLEEFVPPEEKKPILDYDAQNSIMFVRFKADDGSYKYNTISLKYDLNVKILANIPDEWSNDKDKLISFGIFDDGTYSMTKKKLKYDFNTNTTKWISYECSQLTLEQAKEFFDILKSMLFVHQTLENYNKSQEIFNAVTLTEQFLDEEYLNKCIQRDSLLRQSDFRILEDYPESFEGEKQLWIEWRSSLRDIVKKMEDFDEIVDYIIYLQEFKWPIDPLIYHEKYQNTDTQYLSTSDQYVMNENLSSSNRITKINESILNSAKNIKSYQKNGVPITKQVYDILEKYRLMDDILNMDVINFTIQE